MKPLPNVTLVVVDTLNKGAAISALQKSLLQVKPDKALLLTDINMIVNGIDVVKIPTISSKDEYSRFIIKELYKYIDTDFLIVMQHDGYVLNGDCFDERLYDYDYCGALWLETDGLNNGNGGFSWRSKKLQEIIAKDDTVEILTPEDVSISRIYRRYLEGKYGLKWATDEIAERFSFELRQPNQKTFGFHNYFHAPYKPYVVVTRNAALGDIVQAEPVLRYYALKGYNVVIDCPIQFYDLYSNHYFPVYHISQLTDRIKPEIQVNLDMSYETTPHQVYLKSYFEFSGIEDYKLSRPQLHPLVEDSSKMFKKYAVIHIDKRETPHRNTYGINWDKVRSYLEGMGYVVIQIGKNDHDVAGIELNTTTVAYMKFVIAGCDLFIGVDSGPASIAVAYNKPSVLLFGSVNPKYIHPDLTNVEIVQGDCDNAFCWHIQGGTSGQKCKYEKTEQYLQCCNHSYFDVIAAINKLNLNPNDQN